MGRGYKPPNVSDFLRQLADLIDSGDVAIAGSSIDRPYPTGGKRERGPRDQFGRPSISSEVGDDPVLTDRMVVTWHPEIQFLTIGEHTQRLVDMLNRYA